MPPYDTPIKKKLILEVLKEEFDPKTSTWMRLTKKSDSKASVPTPIPVTIPTRTHLEEEVSHHSSQQRMLVIPSEDSRHHQFTSFDILDPDDDIGFTHFVANMGTEMCGQHDTISLPSSSHKSGPSSPTRPEREASQQKVLTVPSEESQHNVLTVPAVAPRHKPYAGIDILDPDDDIGFTHFVTNMGDICGERDSKSLASEKEAYTR